jgi:archaellum component FlaF (FlaF/FlaG flagellin family)
LATVGLTSGKAAFTTSTLAAGSHSITATYNGSTGFNPSTSAILTQSVNP